MPDGFFLVDFAVFQLNVATSGDGDGCPFCDLDGLLVGSTLLGGHHFLVGVD